MFKRNLFKRFLPIALSVAMTVQSLPVTSYAAEGTTEPETAVEQTTDEVVDDETDDNGAGSSETVDGQNEGENEESKSPETQATVEETKPDETQQTEETKVAEETKTAEETKPAEETKTAEAEKEEEVEEVADNAEAVASKAVISVNENTLVNNLSGYTYDYTTKTVEKSFKADSTETAEKVLDATKAAVKVTVDEQDSSTAKEHVTYKWQQKNAEGNFADMPAEELPQAAGEYKLVISLGAVDGVCAAADDVSVSLTIKKAEITLDNTVKQFNPGVTVAEVKEKNADFTLKENNTTLTKDAYISASTIEVKDAAGTVLADTAVLEKDKDYTLNINVTLKDEFAKNYEVKSEPVNIVFGNAVTTDIKVTYKKEGEAIGKTYDGKAIDAATEVESKYDAKVVYTKDGKETELAGAKLTATWCNADGVAYVDIDEEKYKDFKPVDAGTYIYRLSYTDETGTYADKEVDVKVVISMVDVVIDPVLDAKEYSEGTDVSAILKSVKYDVYEVKNGVKAEKPMTIDKNYFWGTSYDANGDAEQYYAPVFAVQQGKKASDGKVTWGAELSDADKLVSGENVVYRVVFLGKKAIYKNGSYSNSIDINKSQQNYRVDVTDGAKSTYAEDITLTAAAEVDVTPILENGKGSEYENAMIRTYDGNAKYKTRGDYKKATAKAGDKTLDASNLVYTWEMADPGSYTKDESGKWIVGEWIEKASFNNNVEDYSNPVNVGEYRLKVEYRDAKNGVSSKEPKYVYYTILPQNVKGVVTGTPKAYADDIEIGDFIKSLQHDDKTAVNTYVEAAVVKVNEDGTTGDDISSEFDLDNCYENPATYFDVVRKIDEGENAGKWVSVDDGETFILGKEYEVRFGGNELVGNYNFGNKLDNHGQIVTDADPLYENTGVKVEVLNSSLIELDIDIDESQITDNIKVYDAHPFDLTALKSLVKVTNRKDGSAVTDAEVKYELLFNPTFDPIYGHLTGAEETWTVEDAIHGGIYSLHIFVETNEKYRYSDKLLSTPFEIKKAKLTVTPQVKDEIKAGSYVGYVYVGDSTGILAGEPEITGYIGDDADLLTSLSAGVYAENSASILNARLRSGKTYYVEYTAGFKTNDGEGNKLYGSRDYEFVSERTAFVPVRAEASVEASVEANNTALLDEISGTPDKGYTHTITTREGIPYDQGRTVNVNGKSDTVEGNLFIFDLYAPDEFRSSNRTFKNSTFVYRNNIEKAGGYVLNVNNYDITVAFKADPEKLTEKKTFEILWDTDYTEKFTIDFSKSILKDDMTKAVAPKSLAFNSVNNKMAVGDTQQLDVKITKNQMRDIILLNYESSDETVLKVTDKGYVTALKKGIATVKVYPCYADKDGKKVAINGAKAATVKITVSDVVAPKISKVTTKGTRATVTYQKPANGYRREIYVLEGKKKADEFEAAIAKVINGDYSAFVVADLTASETPDEKGNVTLTVGGLSPKSEYTVYVRNVSGLRALEDGSQVASSYAGAVKTFKTTKANATELYTYFKQGNGQTAIEGDSYEYVAKLKDKSAQLSVDARLYEKYSQKYSDSQDYIWRTLPLSGSDKDNYEEPKLAYCVLDPYTSSSTTKVDGWYSYNGKWYKPSSIASVDKKGKVTFKGEGLVKIYVYDTITGISDSVELYIETAPDSVKGKNIKMSVGQGIWLSNYLEYKEGKNKVENYQDYVDLSIDKESDKNFDIVRWGGDYWIKALNPGAKLTLKVTDSAVKANKGKDTTVTITTTAINPVKGLKVQSVDDQNFTVTYSYPLYGYDFRFDLKDASGKVIDSVIEYKTGTWNTKTKTYDYTETFNNPEITRLSTYSLTVTALFNGQESKPAKLTVKTTDIPASYLDLGKKGNESWSTPILVTTKTGRNSYGTGQIPLSIYPVLKSGNTYTLDVPLTGSSDNRAARDRKTDTLTWKSTNPKVATVKANAGSYTATLKALNKGETIIEVTSKITKKVIARYTVTINAVGEAGGYFGDNEPYKGSDTGISDVVIDEKDMIELTMNNRINYSLNKGEGQWYVFTAPAYGYYTFSSQQSAYIYSGNKVLLARGTSRTEALEKGSKRYIYIVNNYYSGKDNGSVSVTGITYTELTLGENKVKGGANVVFIAPTDNHYVISYDENGNTNKNEYDLTAGVKQTLTIGSTGKDYVVKVSCREADKAAVGGDGAVVSLGEGTEKWFSFTADETGIYTFYATGASGAITGTIKKGMKDSSEVVTSAVETLAAVETAADTPKDYKFDEIKLEKGQTVYIELTAAGATKDKAVTATFKVDKAPSVGADGKAGAKTEANVAKTITYVIPSQGDYRFTFTSTPADAKITGGTVTVGDNSKPINNNVFEDTFAKNAFVKISVTTDKAADVSVAVEKTTKKVLSIGDNKVNLAANATETVAFYATNSGYYTFKFAPTTVKADETEYLVAGQCKEISLTSATAQEVTVTVSKADVATLTAGDVTIGSSGIKYFKYTASKEGLYSFAITPEAEVIYSESSSLKFDESTNYIGSTVYMKAGETFYVKISSTANAAATAKATVTIDALQVTALTAGTEAPIEIEAGKSAWVEFTAKKTARYEYKKQDDIGFEISKASSLGTTNGTFGFSDSKGEVINAGTKKYFKVTNNNAEKKTIKLTVSEVVPVAAGQSAELKNSEGKWFEFTADAAARYTFSATAVKEGQTPGASISGVITKLTDANNTSEGGSLILKQGDKRYFYITASYTGTDTVAVSLKAVKAGQDGELTAADGIEFKADALTKTLSWTAPKAGWYRFTAKVGDAEIYRDKLTFDFYRNLSDTKENENEPCESGALIPCDAGDKFTFVVTSKEPQTVKFAMTKETVIPVTSTETEVKMTKGAVKYFSFEAKEQARYFIELTNISEGLSLYVSSVDNGASAEDLISGYATFVGNVGEEYVYAIQANGVFEGEKSFKIKGGAVAPTALAAGTPATITKGSLTPNHYAWYKFTAPEDGKYAFKLTNAEAYYIVDEPLTSDLDYAYLPEDIKLEKGAVVYFAVYNGGTSDANKDVVLSVNKVAATTLTEAAPVKIAVADLVAGEKRYISFTAPADGRYIFTNDAGITSTPTYGALDDEDSNGSMTWGTETGLKKGDELLFAVSVNPVPSADINISVSHVATKAITTSAEPKDVEFKADESRWMVFTADKTGKYTFEFAADEFMKVEMYSSIADTNGSSQDITVEAGGKHVCSLNKGDSVYFLVHQMSGERTAFNIKIKASLAEEMTALKFGDNPFETTDKAKYAYFTATEAGVYKFTVSANEVIQYSHDIDNIETGIGNSGNDNVSYILEVGDSIYFKETVNNKGTIKVEQSGTIEVLKENATKTLSVNKTDYKWISFTAKESSYYSFDLSKGTGCYINYDNRLGYYYDDGYYYFDDYKNSAFMMNLGENETIYLALKSTSSSVTTATICAKQIDISHMDGENTHDLTVNKGEVKYIEFDPQGLPEYDFTVSATSNVSVAYATGSVVGSYVSAGVGKESEFELTNLYKPVYIRLTGTQDDTDVTVSAKSNTKIYSINAGRNNISESIVPQETRVYKFTAPKDAAYKFEFDNYSGNSVTIVAKDEWDDKYSTTTTSGKPYIGVSLYEDTTRYVYVTNNSKTYPLSGSVTVYTTQQNWLDVDAEYPVTVESYGAYEFCAYSYESGYYTFYSTGNTDSWASLYIDGTEVAVNDDGGDGNNFRIVRYIEAGHNIRLLTRGYNNNAASYTVHMTRSDTNPDAPSEEP